MGTRTRTPAAYIGVDRARGPVGVARQHYAISEAVRRKGWPEPTVYVEDAGAGGRQPAVADLTGAISAGRHDVLLVSLSTVSGLPPGPLMRLLTGCTRQGVPVQFLTG